MARPKIERYHGQVVKVGNSSVKTVVLPDWGLEYVEYPKGQRDDYRLAISQAHLMIVKVTSQRIYFTSR